MKFAARAYRRPLSAAERADLLAFYRSLRDKKQPDARRGDARLDRQRADVARTSAIASTCRAAPRPRRTPPVTAPAAGRQPGVQPLSDYALASRLSYFLWSSMPDAELLARAAAGELRTPEVLARAGPPDAEGRSRARPGHGVRRQLAGFPPFRGAQHAWIASASRPSRTSCARRCSRSRSGSSST